MPKKARVRKVASHNGWQYVKSAGPYKQVAILRGCQIFIKFAQAAKCYRDDAGKTALGNRRLPVQVGRHVFLVRGRKIERTSASRFASVCSMSAARRSSARTVQRGFPVSTVVPGAGMSAIAGRSLSPAKARSRRVVTASGPQVRPLRFYRPPPTGA